MKKLYTALSSIFAVIPGLAIIISGITVLPGKGLLFGGCIESLCCLCIFILYSNREKIKASTKRKINFYVLICSLVFLTSLCAYIVLYGNCVFIDEQAKIENPKSEPEDYSVVFPVVSRGDVENILRHFPNKQAAVNTIGSSLLNDSIRKDTKMVALTFILFLLLYILFTCSLTASFTLLAICENAGLSE